MFSPTAANLMLEMSEPIHSSGIVITHDSGFCMTEGIVAQHNVKKFGQALIKKRGCFWPDGVPGDQINDHFTSLPIIDSDTLEQSIDSKIFLIHCTKDDSYVRNHELSQNIVLDWVSPYQASCDHTRQVVNGNTRISFSYTNPISCHNLANCFGPGLATKPLGLMTVGILFIKHGGQWGELTGPGKHCQHWFFGKS